MSSYRSLWVLVWCAGCSASADPETFAAQWLRALADGKAERAFQQLCPDARDQLASLSLGATSEAPEVFLKVEHRTLEAAQGRRPGQHQPCGLTHASEAASEDLLRHPGLGGRLGTLTRSSPSAGCRSAHLRCGDAGVSSGAGSSTTARSPGVALTQALIQRHCSPRRSQRACAATGKPPPGEMLTGKAGLAARSRHHRQRRRRRRLHRRRRRTARR